jgi:hypothetical protein
MVRTPWDAWCWCPFCDKVSKDLALDGMAWLEVELESSKLSCPLGDVACGVGIVEDGPRRVGGHHHNLVGLEIVMEFPGCNEYGIKELMRLRIPGLCLMKDLADVVDRLLDGPDTASRTGSFCLCWGLIGPQVASASPGRDPAGPSEAGPVVRLVEAGPPSPTGGSTGTPCGRRSDLSMTSTMLITSAVAAR